jgi:cell division protein FtsB
MNVDLGIWGKLTRVVVVLIVLAAITGVVLWYLPNIRENEYNRRRILELQAQIQKHEEISRNLKTSIDALRNDRRTIESRAREALGVGRSNETIIVFEAPANTGPAVSLR